MPDVFWLTNLLINDTYNYSLLYIHDSTKHCSRWAQKMIVQLIRTQTKKTK